MAERDAEETRDDGALSVGKSIEFTDANPRLLLLSISVGIMKLIGQQMHARALKRDRKFLVLAIEITFASFAIDA